MIEILESRLKEDVSYSNCIANLIISHGLNRNESYRNISTFILGELFLGLKVNFESGQESWGDCIGALSSCEEVSSTVELKLAKEVEKSKVEEDKCLFNILIKLFRTHSISEDEEQKLVTFLVTKKKEKCDIHWEKIQLYCYKDEKELCIKCLIGDHSEHAIEPIGTAKHKHLLPCWERLDSELDQVKFNSKLRISEIDLLIDNLSQEKLRDVGILKGCADIKPRMEDLSKMFESGSLDFVDSNIVALENFVSELKKESIRCKDDFDRAKLLSALMEKRCASCAAIAYADLEFEIHDDSEEMDLNQALSTKNCISILRQSKKVGNQQLYDQVFDYILKNFMGVVNENKTSFYRRISQSVLEDFTKSDKLNVESEDDVVSVVNEWIHFDFWLRKKNCISLLKHVRFGKVSSEMLREIESDPDHVIMINLDSRKLVENAIAGYCTANSRYRFTSKLLVFGQDGENLMFDPVKGIWTEWHGENHGIYFCVVIVGVNVFLIGGHPNLSKVSIYNTQTKVWTAGPSMLEGRHGLSASVTSTNAIYVMGGVGKNIPKSVEMLQCNGSGEPIGSWLRLPAMNTERYHFQAACVDDEIYAIGGYYNIATVEVFDPKMNSWIFCKSRNQGNHWHTVSTYNGEIYIVGRDGFCEKYNPSIDNWTAIAQLNHPDTNSPRGSVVVNDKIYVIGGDNCIDVDIYDITSDSWSKGPPMPRIFGFTLCVYVERSTNHNL